MNKYYALLIIFKCGDAMVMTKGLYAALKFNNFKDLISDIDSVKEIEWNNFEIRESYNNQYPNRNIHLVGHVDFFGYGETNVFHLNNGDSVHN